MKENIVPITTPPPSQSWVTIEPAGGRVLRVGIRRPNGRYDQDWPVYRVLDEATAELRANELCCASGVPRSGTRPPTRLDDGPRAA